MTDAHRRKKDPDHVRAALIESARRLAIEQGIMAVGVQAVADAAGVTKGGLFHHFPTKQALVDALIDDLMGSMEADIDARMAADPEAHGRFTRAYVEMTFANDEAEDDWSPLWMSMVADQQLRHVWRQWFAERLIRHADTDGGLELEAIRFTADGVWLGQIVGIHPRDREGLRDLLVAMTRAPVASR